ncbi:MAG: hypothetical protein Q4F98_05995 [Lachnospiraceae bacterium]|nr:hypothetical protein [Lachnospiraceae bacterium]
MNIRKEHTPTAEIKVTGMSETPGVNRVSADKKITATDSLKFCVNRLMLSCDKIITTAL